MGPHSVTASPPQTPPLKEENLEQKTYNVGRYRSTGLPLAGAEARSAPRPSRHPPLSPGLIREFRQITQLCDG